ncbi:MAG: isoprenylcysteine carboxylmethyltransferase family protein [Gemmatimonadota bacterium]|nr:MAG: isoprenylcysteine carboxylmethyltransferase family protein [Gemmatimonadota bacterium]
MELRTYVILAVLTLVIAYVVFRVIVRRDYQRKGKLTPFSSFMEYVAIGSWVYFTYVNVPPDWPAIHVSPALEVIGSILFYGGLAVTLVALVWLGVRRSHGLEVSQLKQSGVYGLTRNPQSLAFVVAIIGNLILWPTWQNLVALIMLAVVLQLMILTEEEHLREVFGEAYETYCRRVPRYVGLRRRSD